MFRIIVLFTCFQHITLVFICLNTILHSAFSDCLLCSDCSCSTVGYSCDPYCSYCDGPLTCAEICAPIPILCAPVGYSPFDSYFPYLESLGLDFRYGEVFENSPGGTTGVATSVGTLALAAAAPPPLPLFPPQGLPQPGVISGGGGAIPASALTVRKLQFKIYFGIYLLLVYYKQYIIKI